MTNLSKRIISSCVMISCLLYIFWYANNNLFFILLLLIATGMFSEWYQMVTNKRYPSSISEKLIYLWIGIVLLSPAMIALLHIFIILEERQILLLYFLIIITVDTMAMVGGKTFKGPKLSPKISPNKTISGLLTGVLSCALVPFAMDMIVDNHNTDHFFMGTYHKIIFCIFLGLLAQLSDLLISVFKRKFYLKDSGSIIPGHGGILDRFDSLVLTAPALYIYLQVMM